jgi:hypothetical protein
MIHKIVIEVITNHNLTLANTVGNVMKTVFFGALVDQTGPAYFSGFNPLAVGSNVTSSSQQPNSGQYQQPLAQQPSKGQALDPQVQLTAGGKYQPRQQQGARSRSSGRGQPLAQQSRSAPITQPNQLPIGQNQVYSVQEPTLPISQQVVQWPSQGKLTTSCKTPQLAYKIAPSVQWTTKDIDPNFFNSQLQGYTTHKAQIDYPEGSHPVSDASTYEMMPHLGYQNPYNYNVQ